MVDLEGLIWKIKLMSEPALKLFVSKIPKEWDEEMVKQYFEVHGQIQQVEVFRDEGKRKV